MLKSILCHYSAASTLVNGTITITDKGADDVSTRLDKRNKGVIFKNRGPFIGCISEINNTKLDNAKSQDVLCGSIIYYNTAININLEVYGNITEINQML